jgi:dihydrofolate reductase
MYPGYEQYWLEVLAHPAQYDKSEVAYARWADQTPHIVLSKTLDRVAWKTTRTVHDVDDIRKLKHAPGKDIYVVGEATLVSSLMNLGLIDELGLMVNPLILGGGKALFKDVKERHILKRVRVQPLKSGTVSLTYSTL